MRSVWAYLLLLLAACGGDDHRDVEALEEADLVVCNPDRTTRVTPIINLSASARPPENSLNATTLVSNTFTLPLANDFSANPISFDLVLSGQGENTGLVSIHLDTLVGVPAQVNTFSQLEMLASIINDQIFSPNSPQRQIDVSVDIQDFGNETYALQFSSFDFGLNSSIHISGVSANSAELGINPFLNSTAGRESHNFDQNDAATYNAFANVTIYDSLGIEHELQMYFVKQVFDLSDPATFPNHWFLIVQVNNLDVGDPWMLNSTLTQATHEVFFSDDGTVHDILSQPVLISNWRPLAEDGVPTGAAGPINVSQGAGIPIPDPPTSSNFVIDLSQMTQFGSETILLNVEQNGVPSRLCHSE